MSLGESPKSVEAAQRLELASAMIREIVRAYADQPLKVAIHEAARIAGLGERRVRAYWHGEVLATSREELRQIGEAHDAWGIAEIERRVRELAVLCDRFPRARRGGWLGRLAGLVGVSSGAGLAQARA